MPSMANITIKKYDGTTDITYAAVVPSSGSNSPAIWRSPVGAAAAHKATLRMKSAPNASGTQRNIEGDFIFPETATAADGKITVVNRARHRLLSTVPLDMADSLIQESVAQAFNLYGSALYRSATIEGYAPT